MRSTVFDKPFEFNIDIEGDQWAQGELIKGVFSIKNQSKYLLDAQTIGLGLAYGQFRKVKKKDPKSFIIHESKEVELSALKPQESLEIPFEFKLDENAPITEKAGSLYILFGNLNDQTLVSHLQLMIEPQQILNDFCMVIENFLRFKMKEKKNKKNSIEVRFVPPQVKEYASIKEMTLNMSLDSSTLNLEYHFNVEKLSAINGNVGVQKLKMKEMQSLGQKEYCFSPGAISQDKVLEKVNKIITLVRAADPF